MAKAKKYRFNEVSPVTSVILNISFTLFAVFCAAPLVLVVMSAFSSEQSLVNNGYSFFPSEFSLDAFKFLFSKPASILRAYGVSIGITALGACVSVLLMMMYAYPLSRQDFPFKKFFTFFVLFTMMFHPGLAPKYLVYTSILQIRDNFLAVLIPLLTNGFYLFVIRTFYKATIPPTLIEAAKIDGCGELRIFFKIVVPCSLPVIGTMGLFMTLAYWNDWMNYMLFISDKTMFNLQYLMQRVLNDARYLAENGSAISASAAAGAPTSGMQMALVVLGVGPLLFAYPFFQRYFVQGLTVGSVKG